MVQAPTERLTLEAFLALPETKPASEYIAGKIVQKPMPSGEHSILQAELVTVINQALKAEKIAFAFPEIRCSFDQSAMVPDIGVFLWQRISRQENGKLARAFSYPDWTIEILSPGQSHVSVAAKIFRCLNAGTQMGWLIAPDERLLFAYPLGEQPRLFEAEDDLLLVPAFAQQIQLTLGDVLSWMDI